MNLLNDDVLQVFGCAVYNLSPVNPARVTRAILHL